ncbi:hypothetical protein ACG2E4_17930, partial [Halalkalibaculum sp. DA384]
TQIEDQSYEEMLQQRVFNPLGMQHSTTRRELVKDRLVTGLNKRGNPTFWSEAKRSIKLSYGRLQYVSGQL